MLDSIDYQQPTTQRPPKWSRSAIIGLCIGVPAPLLGYAAAHLPTVQSTHELWLEVLVFTSPMLVGLLLSIVGICLTTIGSRRARGRWLAIAGTLINVGWLAALLVLLISAGN